MHPPHCRRADLDAVDQQPSATIGGAVSSRVATPSEWRDLERVDREEVDGAYTTLHVHRARVRMSGSHTFYARINITLISDSIQKQSTYLIKIVK